MRETNRTIKLNAVASRQAADFEGGEDELLALVARHFLQARTPKEGVKVVPVPPDLFRSTVIPVTPETLLKAEFAARREGEDAFIIVKAVAPKAPVKAVNVVLYHRDLLGEDATTDAEWEVVGINSFIMKGGEPMTPIAMAKNYLGLPGGTKADYTAEEFARSILFWSRHATVMASQEIEV